MSEHKHGSMDIHDQEKTFHGFLKLGRRTAYFCIFVLVVLMIYST